MKNFHIIKSILCLLLLSNVSCADNEKQSQKDLQNLFYKYHLKNSTIEKSKNEIEIISSKEIHSYYNGVFYKIKGTNELYFGITDKNKILSINHLQGKEKSSLFNKSNCIIRSNNKGNTKSQDIDDCFTFFAGEFPYQGYTQLEFKWDCSNKDVASENLLEGKYFFFLKEGENHEICNLRAKKEDGQFVNITYDINNKLFKKTTNILTVSR